MIDIAKVSVHNLHIYDTHMNIIDHKANAIFCSAALAHMQV